LACWNTRVKCPLSFVQVSSHTMSFRRGGFRSWWHGGVFNQWHSYCTMNQWRYQWLHVWKQTWLWYITHGNPALREWLVLYEDPGRAS
jgi:hypothetical protein